MQLKTTALRASAQVLTPLGQVVQDRCIGELHHRFGKNVGACENERQEAAWWARHFQQIWEGR